MNMMTTAALGTEISLSSAWVAWMICICALNGVTALACVAFVLHKADMATTPSHCIAPVAPAPIPPRVARQGALEHDHPQDEHHAFAEPKVCGKRKTRGQIEFPFVRKQRDEEEEPAQGRLKLRRITKIAVAHRQPRRSHSFGYDARAFTPSPPSPLRRVVSCDDEIALRYFGTTTKTTTPPVTKPTIAPTAPTTLASVTACIEATIVTALPREIRLRDVLSSAKAVLVAKLREAARNAVDEMLTSIISFVTYGMLLFIFRQYSAVAVGVSLDLGAFSIEL